MIFVQLRKRHLPQRDDQAASSGKQRQANRSITLPLCPPRQIADSWILFNSGAMPLGDKAKAALPLRAATLKQQAMITRHSGKAASGKLVWNQHNAYYSILGMSIISLTSFIIWCNISQLYKPKHIRTEETKRLHFEVLHIFCCTGKNIYLCLKNWH